MHELGRLNDNQRSSAEVGLAWANYSIMLTMQWNSLKRDSLSAWPTLAWSTLAVWTLEFDCWIQSFVTTRFQEATVNKSISSDEAVLSGVHLGSVLALCFLSSWLGTLMKTSNPQTSDALPMTPESQKDATQLQTDLEAVYNWVEKNKTKFNKKNLI